MEPMETSKVENVRLLDRFDPRHPVTGTLYLTATHLIFIDPDGKKETWILHQHIASVEKLQMTAFGSPLRVKCKTYMNVTFILPRERECQDIMVTLQKLSRPESLEDLYCFHYVSQGGYSQTDGLQLFSLEKEFFRMGIPNQFWDFSHLNKNYELCDTYANLLVVPTSATTPMLMGSSRFRSRGRLPALSYLHRNGASICRCSQPLAGFSARCLEDEQLLRAILQTNPKSARMCIVDTRPKINAMANRAKGKGYENENYYTDVQFHFIGIENIHVMRNGLSKLMDACDSSCATVSSYLSALDKSDWLKHIKAILDTSVFIANKVEDEAANVVVHCSDGWDRTAQTCSIASLLLDPYFRTIHGFQALIEKEWLSFGHKFTDRCGFLDADAKETSPVFTQFIDCVWQLTQLYPMAFQFNERFLVELHDHVYSCQFGTFVGNCEKDRVDLMVSQRTYSLWAFMQSRIDDYLNHLFQPNSNHSPNVMRPDTSSQNLRLWVGLYLRFEDGLLPRESIADWISATKGRAQSLNDHTRLLEKRIADLRFLVLHRDDLKSSTCHSEGHDVDSGLSENEVGSDKQSQKYRSESGEPTARSSGDLPEDSLTSTAPRVSDTESGFEELCHPSSRASFGSVGVAGSTLRDLKRPSVDLSLDQIALELNSVAIDWKNPRDVTHCGCAAPFRYLNCKYNCWKCGEVYCGRCIDRHIALPGHYSGKSVPVCRPCYKTLKSSPSYIDLAAVAKQRGLHSPAKSS